MKQDILEMGLDVLQSYENYWAQEGSNNYKILDFLKQLSEQSTNGSAYFLVGASGTGKTHLLKALEHQLVDKACYLNLTSATSALNNYNIILIDNIDQLAADTELQQKFFTLCNQLQNHNSVLIVAGRIVPSLFDLELKDVKSRLQAFTLLTLDSADEEERIAILKFRAKRQGLMFDDKTINYLMMRSSRDLHVLMEYLQQFNREGLRHQKKLGISLIKETLNW